MTILSPIPIQQSRSPIPTGETDDIYPAVFQFKHCRIIRCKDDIQWIVQLRISDRWRSASYHIHWSSLINRYADDYPIPEVEPDRPVAPL